MRFTRHQYDVAIQSLTDACQQLEPDGNCCVCCGDSGHQAFECGHNPLLAMAVCKSIAQQAQEFHETLHDDDCDEKFDVAVHSAQITGDICPLLSLISERTDGTHELVHYLSGANSRMGCMIGPAAIHMPTDKDAISVMNDINIDPTS